MDQKQQAHQAPASATGGPPVYTAQPISQFTSGPVATVGQDAFGPYPMRLTCGFCNAHVMTGIEHVPGSLTYILGVVLCLFTCCCCIPFCVDRCQDVEHVCPNCHRKLGLYKRL